MPKESNERVHLGRNIRRLREIIGMKQEALAYELGDDWTQKKISLLEQKESIEDGLLDEVAKALKLPVEAIKNFDEEQAVHNIQNNYDNSVINAGPTINYKCNFNPLDKYVEQVEENKKLYQALLKEKDEKIVLLEKMLEKKS